MYRQSPPHRTLAGPRWLAALVAVTAVPAWFPRAEPLPAPQGEVIHVASAEELLAAVEHVAPGGTILLADGEYRVPRPVILDGRKHITIRSASGDPTTVTLRGQGWDSRQRSDDILRIAHCDGVTVADLTFTDCHAYAIKVEAENAPRDIHIYNCHFRDIGTRAIKGSASQDVQRHAVGGSIRFCRFENTRIPESDWLFDGDYISAIDMMALQDWTISDNVFRNIRGRNGGARAAIFIWVRSERIRVERNLIVDCDRAIAFGNPGQSTADRPDDRPIHVTGGTIRNNVIAGGPDGAIELWYSRKIDVFHNSIWRPETNWNRGIRVGRGTVQTEIANNLIHGEIQMEGGEARLQQNLTGQRAAGFADPVQGDLTLTAAATEAIDAGLSLPEVAEDIARRPRDPRPDIGAWEFVRE